jgi:hypothetical protein
MRFTGRLPSDTLLKELRPEFFSLRWDLLMTDAMAKMHRAGIGVSTGLSMTLRRWRAWCGWAPTPSSRTA